jgi:hypothetical protein
LKCITSHLLQILGVYVSQGHIAWQCRTCVRQYSAGVCVAGQNVHVYRVLIKWLVARGVFLWHLLSKALRVLFEFEG